MKQKLLGQLLPLLLLCAMAKAQTTEVNTDFASQMNTAFARLDKSRVPTGLLQDYAFDLAELGGYNGVLTDSNCNPKSVATKPMLQHQINYFFC